MQQIEYTRTILGKGLLDGWQVLLIAALVLVIVVLALRGSLARVRDRRVARALLAVKIALILLLAWALYQPSLYVKKTITQPGRLVLLVDDSASMDVIDEPASASDALDLVEAVEPGRLTARVDAAGLVRRRLRAALDAMADVDKRVADFVGTLEEGLPWRSSVQAELEQAAADFAGHARQVREAFGHLRTQTASLPQYKLTDEASDALRSEIEAVSLISGKLEETARRFGSLAELRDVTPKPFADFRNALAETRTQTHEALARAEAIQAALDEALMKSDADALKLAGQIESLPRRELVRHVLAQSPAVEELKTQHRLVITSLGEEADASSGTDFQRPLRKLLNTYARETLSGIVLLSDGQENAHSDLAPVLRTMRAKQIPLHTIAVGSPVAVRDFALADYRLPVIAERKRSAYVTCTVKTSAPEGTPFTLTVMREKRILAEETYKTDGTRERRIVVRVRFDEEGVAPVTLAVAPADHNDKVPGNNTVTDTVYVVKSKPRVLVLADVPTWDVRYLLAAMEALPLKVSAVMTGASEKAPERGSDTDEVPQKVSHWKRYDLVILAGTPFANFAKEDAAALHETVTKHGAALLILPGRNGGYARALADAFGWQMPGVDHHPEFAPPQEKLHTPPLALTPKRAESLARWQTLTSPEQIAAVPAQDATLLESKDGLPLLTFGLHGKGRCVLLGIADTYRMRTFDGWPDAETFMAQLAALALADPTAGHEGLATLPVLPVKDAETCLIYPKPTGAPATDELKLPWLAGAVTDVLLLRPTPTGNFASVGQWPVAAEVEMSLHDGTRQLQWKLPVRRAIQDERIYFAANESLLRDLAASTDAQFVRLTELPELKISAQKQVEVRVNEYTLWHTWLFLLLIITAATAEYLLRRKAGMVL